MIEVEGVDDEGSGEMKARGGQQVALTGWYEITGCPCPTLSACVHHPNAQTTAVGQHILTYLFVKTIGIVE